MAHHRLDAHTPIEGNVPRGTTAHPTMAPRVRPSHRPMAGMVEMLRTRWTGPHASRRGSSSGCDPFSGEYTSCRPLGQFPVGCRIVVQGRDRPALRPGPWRVSSSGPSATKPSCRSRSSSRPTDLASSAGSMTTASTGCIQPRGRPKPLQLIESIRIGSSRVGHGFGPGEAGRCLPVGAATVAMSGPGRV